MKLPECAISAIAFAALVTGILCEPVAAAVIFASGTPPTVHDTTGGTIISDISGMRQYIGVRFQIVAQPVLANEIGGNLIRGRDFGNNQIFAALIALSGATDFPDSARPLNTPDVLRVALITPPSPFNDDVSAAINPIVLAPGYYALFFGTNQFGATGEGQASPNTNPIDTPSFFFWNGSTFINQSGTVRERFFVNGLVPDPSGGAAALGTTIAVVSMRRRRRPRHGVALMVLCEASRFPRSASAAPNRA